LAKVNGRFMQSVGIHELAVGEFHPHTQITSQFVE
jgi:hypothetical protein